MRRILTYLLAIIACVGCSTFEPSDTGNSDPQPEPKPVRPIKPRPIVPDGTIKRPRIVEVSNDIVVYIPGGDRLMPFSVHVVAEQSGEEYCDLCNVANGYIVIPRIGSNEHLTLTLDNGEESYTFVVDETEK